MIKRMGGKIKIGNGSKENRNTTERKDGRGKNVKEIGNILFHFSFMLFFNFRFFLCFWGRGCEMMLGFPFLNGTYIYMEM